MNSEREFPLWMYYVLPMGLFMALTAVEGVVPRALYPFAYLLKVLLVGGALVCCAPRWRHEFRPTWLAAGLGLAVGLLGVVLWIVVDRWTPHLAFLGTRTALNPFAAISDPALRVSFIALRLIGMTLLVPLMEEVFWRSFVHRFVIDPDAWQTLRIGVCTPLAVGAGAMLFGASHPEWLAASVFALLMIGLCRVTGNLFASTIAHATTNLTLAIYVLETGAWAYW
jgi:uncharacterized protein